MYSSFDSFDAQEKRIQNIAAEFARDVVAPKVFEMDKNETMDPEVLKGLFKNGLMGIEAGENYGGLGASYMSYILTIEELAKVDSSVAVVCDVQNTIINAIVDTFGTPEQKELWITELVAQGKIASFCLSELNAGSDITGLKTTASQDQNGEWVISGTKKWCTNAREADVFVIFAITDLPQGSGKGITCFIANKDNAITIVDQERNLGIRAASVCTLEIDNLRVPSTNMIGKQGQGAQIALNFLNKGRVGMAANMVGLAQGAFSKAVAYISQRQAFGKIVGQFQGMQFQVANAATEIETARLLTYNAARRCDEHKDFSTEGAMAKYWASGVASRVSGLAIELEGGVGFTRDGGIEKYWRDCKIGAIFEGTSNIQLISIANAIGALYSAHPSTPSASSNPSAPVQKS